MSLENQASLVRDCSNIKRFKRYVSEIEPFNSHLQMELGVVEYFLPVFIQLQPLV